MDKPLDRVVGFRAVDPLIAVHPDAKLELHAPGHGFRADEFQRFEIAVALRIRQAGGSDMVSGHGQQERVSEEEIRIQDVAEKIVTDPEAQVKAVVSAAWPAW